MARIAINQMLNFTKTRRFELHHPKVWAGIVAIFVYYLNVNWLAVNELLYSSGVTFGSVVFGFVGVAFVVFNTGTDIMKKIRHSNQKAIHDMRRYIAEVLISAVLFCMVNMAGLLFFSNIKGELLVLQMFMSAWFGLLVYCLACLYRLSKIALVIFSRSDNT